MSNLIKGLALILTLAGVVQAQVVVQRQEIHTAKQCIYYDCPNCDYFGVSDSCEEKRSGPVVWNGPKCLCLDQSRYYIERIDSMIIWFDCPHGPKGSKLCGEKTLDTVWVNYPLILGTQKIKWVKGKAEVDWPFADKRNEWDWGDIIIYDDVSGSIDSCSATAVKAHISDSLCLDH